jgi:tetratricopeptide (TPR) repeat protein
LKFVSKFLILTKFKTHEMKRLILLTAAVALMLGNVQAQDPSAAPLMLNKKTLEKKAAKSDEAIQDEKKQLKAATWSARGRLFQDIDNQGLEQAYLAMDDAALKLMYQEPLSVEEKEDNVRILKYETIHYVFENNRLRGWTRVDPIHESPLDEALRSYLKAIDLTEEGKRAKLEEKIKKDLDELKTQFRREGQNKYYLQDLPAALNDFEQILEVNKIAIYNGLIDTTMINFSGIVAREIGRQNMDNGNKEVAEAMYKKTIDYYTQLAEIGFGGSSGYVQMTRDFYAMGDTLGAIENLKKGLKQYPDSTLLVTVAAQAFYLMGDNEGGLEFVAERLAEQPKCPAAYYWKGLLITNKDDVEEEVIKESLALYDTSLMYDPTNGNVWYQSGYVNYAVGANYFEQESYEEDDEFRAELKEKGTGYYETAVEKLEKTYEISSADPTLRKESLDLLKRIYYKLYGSEDSRYISVNERLNNL